ncbi:uncharacterized protein LOC143240409 isoform X2 [Tachypleus tridentatus]|uniref:uncharacterized protein LOC143240409 isoform X2 n=1 Tax=Tachypleus tridentatus TaxID=6853 RepID=UPI003FD2B37D
MAIVLFFFIKFSYFYLNAYQFPLRRSNCDRDLSHNQIRLINSSTFGKLQYLEELKVIHNHLSDIPDLGEQQRLKTLNLNHNEIYTITVAVLEKYKSLEVLDLDHNKIVDIPVGSFPKKSKLLHLNLNNNRIVNIEEGAFDSLTSLETLKLNKNRLSTIPKNLFKRLHTLKHLELNKNRIQKIEGLSFHGLESLQVLKLRRNGIEQLLDGAFWGLHNIHHLHLDYNSIRHVKKAWLYKLSSLKSLSLTHNKISEVEEEGWVFCDHLKDLNLKYNQLKTITKDTFSKLFKLHILDLEYNNISYIEDRAFEHLTFLQVLKLSNNEISWTIEDTDGAFSNLTSLMELGLANNRIKSIAKKAFVGLHSLHSLDLTGNPITAIQENSFQSLQNLQELKFNTTCLLCDCSLKWLSKWLIISGFSHSVIAYCGHPESLKNQSIFTANPENFTCDDSPKPYITENPQTLTALQGENTTLVCKAASSKDTPAVFQWRKNNKLLLEAEMENFNKTGDDGVTKHASLLHIRNISDDDEGRYQCVISNQYGTAYSDKAHITVHVFPVFTKTPVDVTVKAGSTARLECAAVGYPLPEIAWQKDGGDDDFPAARERRMHVMPSDDVFFIVKVKTSDMGTYSCTAKNDAGVIMANATLTVLETPTFVKPMGNKETRVGETAVLECMAAGSPKPSLAWLKDDAPLVPTERYFFTADSQLLIIVQTKLSDSGKYVCNMSNTMGSKSDSSYLTVLPATRRAAVGSEDDNTTTGIIIISVVCCVVGTSLVWVIIIYKTRKRGDDYPPTKTDETTLPCDMIPSFNPYPHSTVEEYKNSTAHLFLDNNSEHSSRDSGTGDSSKQSSDEFLPLDENSGQVLLLPHKRTTIPHFGSSVASMLGQQSNISVDTVQSSSSTRTSSRQQRAPLLHTFHTHPKGDKLWRGHPISATNQAMDEEDGLHRPPSNQYCWPVKETKRSFSVGHLAVNPEYHSIPNSSRSCRSIYQKYQELSESEVTDGKLGFEILHRNGEPSSADSWSTCSLKHSKVSKERQKDSGSFSLDSEDQHLVCQSLLHSQGTSSFIHEPVAAQTVSSLSQVQATHSPTSRVGVA